MVVGYLNQELCVQYQVLKLCPNKPLEAEETVETRLWQR